MQRTLAAIAACLVPLVTLAAEPGYAISQSVVAKPEGLSKRTLVAVTDDWKNLSGCMSLLKTIQERQDQGSIVSQACGSSLPESLLPILNGGELPDAHYVSYADMSLGSHGSKVFVVFHSPDAGQSCTNLLAQHFGAIPGAVCTQAAAR